LSNKTLRGRTIDADAPDPEAQVLDLLD